MNSPQQIVGDHVSPGQDIFLDRDEIREAVTHVLTATPRRLGCVWGPRGFGKSALAARIGEMFLESQADNARLIYMKSAGNSPITVNDVLGLAFAALGDEAGAEVKAARDAGDGLSPLEKSRRLLNSFQQIPCLIIWDNFELQQDAYGEIRDSELVTFLTALLAGKHGVRLLITSQRPLDIPDSWNRHTGQWELDYGLPPQEAKRLVRELDFGGRAGLERADESTLEAVIAKLHGNPKALEIVVARLKKPSITRRTIAEVLTTIHDEQPVAEQLATSLIEELGEDELLVVRALAIFEVPMPVEALDFVVDRTAPEANAIGLADRLSKYFLVRVNDHTGLLSLHPLERDVAYGQTSAAERRRLELLAAQWYAAQSGDPASWKSIDDLTMSRRQFGHLIRGGDFNAAARVFNGEGPEVSVGRMMVIRGAVHAATDMFAQLGGKVTDDRAWHEAQVHAAFAQTIGGTLREAMALLESALADPAQLSPKVHQHAMAELGDVQRRLGLLHEAVATTNTAVELAEQQGWPERRADALGLLSLTYCALSDADNAFKAADLLWERAQQTGDPHDAAITHDCRSLAFLVQRSWPDVLREGELAVECYARAKETEPVGYARNIQGLALIALDRLPEAITMLDAAASDDSVRENPRARGTCLFNLAWAQLMAADHAAALAAGQEALEVLGGNGADVDAAQSLVDALSAIDTDRFGEHLRQLAANLKNPDLVPVEWVEAKLQ